MLLERSTRGRGTWLESTYPSHFLYPAQDVFYSGEYECMCGGFFRRSASAEIECEKTERTHASLNMRSDEFSRRWQPIHSAF